MALDAEAAHFHALKVEVVDFRALKMEQIPAMESATGVAIRAVAEDRGVRQRRRSSKVYLVVPAEAAG